MIRVLQISDSLKQRFGVTAYLMNYNSAIDTKKAVFDYLIIDSETEIKNKITSLGGKIYTMPKLGLTNVAEFLGVIKSFFSKHHYDIVHSHFYQVDLLIEPIALRNGTKHYISHAHAVNFADTRIKSIRNFIMSYPIRYTSTDFCGCSKKAGEFLFGKRILKFRGKTVNIIPNAISYNKFYYDEMTRAIVRKKYDLQGKNVYGNIGSFKPPKNHIFLIEVFRYICKKDPNAILMLVGDGELREIIENKAKELGVFDKTIFVGTTDSPQQYYNAFDCYIFPSLYEGFGLSLLEAEVNGIPCVCSDSIPDEPIICDNVKRLPLTDSRKIWASACIDALKIGRRKNSKLNTSYDLTEAANKLVSYYEKLL